MKNIIYVTGNYGKYVSVKEHFEEKNIGIDFYEYDFKEIEINDIEKISRKKALDAYLGTLSATAAYAQKMEGIKSLANTIGADENQLTNELQNFVAEMKSDGYNDEMAIIEVWFDVRANYANEINDEEIT